MQAFGRAVKTSSGTPDPSIDTGPGFESQTQCMWVLASAQVSC